MYNIAKENKLSDRNNESNPLESNFNVKKVKTYLIKCGYFFPQTPFSTSYFMCRMGCESNATWGVSQMQHKEKI